MQFNCKLFKNTIEVQHPVVKCLIFSKSVAKIPPKYRGLTAGRRTGERSRKKFHSPIPIHKLGSDKQIKMGGGRH